MHRMVTTILILACGGCERITPPPAAPPPPAAGAWFVDATVDLGIDFALDRSVAGDHFMPDSMGPGCAVLDADGDGRLDLYLACGFRDRHGHVVTDAGANRLYLQTPGGRFTDASASSGAADRGYGMGVAAGDYDNDGDVDLYLANYGRDALYRNAGDGTFTNVTEAAGIDNPAWSASAGFLDYDGDGFLDVYVSNYLAYDPARRGADAAGRPEYASPAMFDGVPDVLYRNNGDGTFTDVSAAAGIAGAAGKGLGVVFTDLDGDRRPDVYVANDGMPNVAWVGRTGDDGTIRFTDRALALGLSVNWLGRPEASMGIATGDTDGDGALELLVTHLVQETNTLYARPAPGRWSDATAGTGLGPPGIDRTGFGTAFLDADLDGDLDVVVANGRVLRAAPDPHAALGPHWNPYAEPNQLFVNDGAGGFGAAPDLGGAFAADVEVSRGLTVGDLDADGDLDLVVASANGTLRVYRNTAPRAGRHWLLVRAIDPAIARDAIGGTIEVIAGGRRQVRPVRRTHSYLSSRDPRAHFGLGPATTIEELVVTWPDATREQFEVDGVDRVIEVRKGRGEGTP